MLRVVLFMGQFIFILGGIKSGKSSYAVQLAKKLSRNVVFIATANASDKEMDKRIKFHKSSRPKFWKTIEESENVAEALMSIEDKYEVIIIDCLGLLVSSLLLKDTKAAKEIKKLANVISKSKQTVILVSNNVGDGLVPDNPLGRRFVDLLGFANQLMAKAANQVIFMQAGIPRRLK